MIEYWRESHPEGYYWIWKADTETGVAKIIATGNGGCILADCEVCHNMWFDEYLQNIFDGTTLEKVAEEEAMLEML